MERILLNFGLRFIYNYLRLSFTTDLKKAASVMGI